MQRALVPLPVFDLVLHPFTVEGFVEPVPREHAAASHLLDGFLVSGAHPRGGIVIVAMTSYLDLHSPSSTKQ